MSGIYFPAVVVVVLYDCDILETEGIISAVIKCMLLFGYIGFDT